MNSHDTKRLIAEAAAHEFVRNGYAGTSLSSISERLGLTKGALTHHFPAKATFATHFAQVVREAAKQAYAFAESEYPDSGTRRLVLLFCTLLHWYETEPQYAAGISLFVDSAAPAFESNDVVRQWITISEVALDDSSLAGEVRTSLTAHEAAEVFIMTNLGAMFFSRHTRHSGFAGGIMHYLRLTLQALGTDDASSVVADAELRYQEALPPLRL